MARVSVRIDANRNPSTGKLANWNFALYNAGRIDAELHVIDSHYFCDLHAVATDKLTLEGQQVVMGGKPVYAYQLIILCRSEVEGEFIDTFYINDAPYKIGAEFYGENESLRINLANQGTEIPAIVGKAIYGSDLYEENVDWVLINRKFRELLVSHLDIMDNKGSYKSLYNALKWFEYDNLVELKEVWRYDTPDGTKYYERPIQTIMTDEVSDRMFNSAKTTYFTLRHLKRHIVGHSGGSPIYAGTTFDYDPDSNDNINGLACKWSEDEMKLKMVLLGNFFETYFMPVHADLIRSVIEDMADYTFNIEFGAGETYHEETVNQSFNLEWGDGDSDATDVHKIMLDEIHAYAGIPQPDPYWQAFENTNPDLTQDDCPIIACHTYEDTEPVDSSEVQVMAAMFGQVYNGIGAIETCHIIAPEPIVAGKLISNQWGKDIETSFSGIAKPLDSFDIKFLFPAPGDFDFYFELTGQSGKHYTKHAKITVVDNLRAQIGFYKMISKPSAEYELINPFTAGSNITPAMSIDRDLKFDIKEGTDNTYTVYTTELDPTYTQYIPIRRAWDEDTPSDAPVTTRVLTIQWVGKDSWNDMEKFPNPSNDYWFERGSNKPDPALEPGVVIPDNEKTAWIRICNKKRGGSPPRMEYGNYRIFYLDVFFPELHTLVKIEPREHISPYYPIVCIPEIQLENDDIRRVNYTLLADVPGWEFFSYGLNRVIERFDKPISTPIIARSIRADMPRGMYRVRFSYKFGITSRTIESNPDWVLENKVIKNA